MDRLTTTSLLVIIWVVFLVWEYFVQQWAKDVNGPIIRVDLVLILPVLLIGSGVLIYQLVRKSK